MLAHCCLGHRHAVLIRLLCLFSTLLFMHARPSVHRLCNGLDIVLVCLLAASQANACRSITRWWHTR